MNDTRRSSDLAGGGAGLDSSATSLRAVISVVNFIDIQKKKVKKEVKLTPLMLPRQRKRQKIPEYSERAWIRNSAGRNA